MRASWLTAWVIALVSMATTARADETQTMGLSLGVGPAWLLADFGEGFESGSVMDFAFSFQEGRVGVALYFMYQENLATSQQNAEASALSGQDTKISFSNGGGGLRVRYLYPGLKSFVSIYGEAGAGANFSSFTKEVAGERADDPVTFGIEGLVGTGISVRLHQQFSFAIGGHFRQAATTERPLSCIGASAVLTGWFY